MTREDLIDSIARMLQTDPPIAPTGAITLRNGLRAMPTEALQILLTEIGHLHREAYRPTDTYPRTIKRRI